MVSSATTEFVISLSFNGFARLPPGIGDRMHATLCFCAHDLDDAVNTIRPKAPHAGKKARTPIP